MTSPLLALRAAIRARCAADTALAALLGGTGAIHDEPPRAAAPVYALFGDAEARGRTDASGRLDEHELSVVVWARPGSAASGLAAAGRIAELLDDAPLALDGHRLVLLAADAVAVDRDRDTNLARAVVKLRAVPESLA